MMRIRHRSRLAWGGFFVLLAILSLGTASACTVPVFRYALDHWEPDPYRLVVPTAWAAERDLARLLVPLRGNGIANVLVVESADSALDRARLLPPRDEAALWEGALDESSLAALLDSSARREIRRRILAGDSAIWVVATPGGDRDELARVAARLRFLEQVAVLPEQDPLDPESRLGPGPPLRLGFSALSLALDDPAERLFAAMLAGPKRADLLDSGEPFAAVVFGRGRVLGAWPLAELDEATIEEASLFLVGRCSCRVKNENPGWDLLLRADWENALAEAGADAAKASLETPVSLEAAPAPESVAEAIAESVVISPLAAESAPRATDPPWAMLAGIALALILVLAGWRLWRTP
jgi:hypothetical protein